ncbi:MAG TPA: carboxypeptidase-like regulatory domain-containing protein [Longimicrobiales bacterium]
MRSVAAAGLALALALTNGPAAAQVLRGRVLDAVTGEGVPSAEVVLSDSTGGVAGSALADSAGLFRIRLAAPGSYGLRVRSLGYHPLEVDSISIGASEEVVVVLRLGLDAVPIQGFEITGRSRFYQGRLEEFYERMARNKRAGIGRFLVREEIEERPVTYATDLLYAFPSVSIQGQERLVVLRRQGRECVPLLYLDGVPINRRGGWSLDEFVRADEVEGIEFYAGFAQGPGEYHDQTGCGVILVWTRRTLDDGRPFTWRRLLAFTAAAVLLFVLLR